MFEKIKRSAREYWECLRDGEPGERFRGFYDFRRDRRPSAFSASRILTLVVAVALVLGGLAIGWLPGPGGFVAIFGIALLATEFRPLASLLDEMETVGRGVWGWFARQPMLAKSGLVLGSAAVVLAGAGLVLYLIGVA
ncbi:MAG: PGPGW domain-containing protein [Phycisphaerales bacterium]